MACWCVSDWNYGQAITWLVLIALVQNATKKHPVYMHVSTAPIIAISCPRRLLMARENKLQATMSIESDVSEKSKAARRPKPMNDVKFG